MSPVEYGPARYRIVYENGTDPRTRTLAATIRWLAMWSGGRPAGRPVPVRVEPVEGTQYRGTLCGRTFNWRSDPDLMRYVACAGLCMPRPRLSKLELRSPVQP